MRDRHFVVHSSHGRYDLREITSDIAASITRYGVVTLDHACQQDGCWHFYFINPRFADRAERDQALQTVVALVPALQGDSSLK